jgi:hypothetical protein
VTEEANLVRRIAAQVGCDSDLVEQTLSEHGLDLAASVRRHRSLRVDRLRIRGLKAGEVEPGPFDETFRFGTGVTVIAAGNLRGKSTLLEIITFVLRGELRDLQADVLSWFTHVSLDVQINGQLIGFRLRLEDSEITEGSIVTGNASELEASDDSLETVAELRWARGNKEWADQVGSFMLTQLGLEEMQVFNKARDNDQAGIIKSHGWPSYFGVLYPPAAADRVLLGSSAGDFLPVRLMQVFLDMPEATRSMRATALVKRLDSELNVAQRKQKGTNNLLARQLGDARTRQATAARQIEELQRQRPAEDLRSLARLAAEAGARVSAARRKFGDAEKSFAEADAAWIQDQRALTALRESAAASALFHGLDPKACPRCEQSISPERRRQEQEAMHCAVCDSALLFDDGDDFAEREHQAVKACEASKGARLALQAAKTAASNELRNAQRELIGIDDRISKAQAALQTDARIRAEGELTASRAVVEALEKLIPVDVKPTTAHQILAAAERILKEGIAQVGEGLYEELSQTICELAGTFGISELERIRIKANGHMEVTKGGGASSMFGAQSPGERLRLRYALIVALLRTARLRGIAGHPGLLLLDSIKAEEVQDDHAQTLLQGLVTAAEEEPGLQILVTTADTLLAGTVSGVEATIVPKPGRSALF